MNSSIFLEQHRIEYELLLQIWQSMTRKDTINFLNKPLNWFLNFTLLNLELGQPGLY